MKSKQLPTKSELHNLFEYRDGHLYWKNARARNTIRAGGKAGYINDLEKAKTKVEKMREELHKEFANHG